MLIESSQERLKALEEFSIADLEAVRITLRGDSVIDWHRMNFASEDEVRDFIVAQEFRPDDAGERARMEAIKDEAINYLRRHFEYPIPKPVEQAVQPVAAFRFRAPVRGLDNSANLTGPLEAAMGFGVGVGCAKKKHDVPPFVRTP